MHLQLPHSSRPWSLAFGVVAAVLVAAPAASQAQQNVACDGTGDFPCGFQLQAVELQPVPRTMKFQARVSQAKLPIGEGVFNRVMVNLKRGDETLCREEFRDVLVSQSVVNLELGRNMSCELDQVIAENPELLFQLCIGGPENCLRPVSFGTAPYAMKSSFAQQSQYAYQADVAGQANYAHRATADRDMFRSRELGKGYFDFRTPPQAPELYDALKFREYQEGGFLQWTPMREAEPTLHISAKSRLNDLPVPLARLILAATTTETTGRLNVQAGGVHVTGASEITGNTIIRGQLKVEKPAGTGPQGVHVAGNSSITGSLSVSQGLEVDGAGATVAGGIRVQGASRFDQATDFTDVVVNGHLRVNGTFEVPGEIEIGSVASDFGVGRDFAVGRDAVVMRDLAVNGGIVAGPSGIGLSAGTAGGATNLAMARAGNTLMVNPGGSHSGGTEMGGNLFVDGQATVNGPVVSNTLHVAGVSHAFVPRGAIVMWSGASATIPAGWALCDGGNGTPDLRDRFILSVASAAENPGATGGTHNQTLTVAQLPAHSHTGNTASAGSHAHSGTTGNAREAQGRSHSHGIQTRQDDWNVSGGSVKDPSWGVDNGAWGTRHHTNTTNTDHTHSFTTNSAGAHAHSFTTDNTGSGQAFDNRPRFYKLAFIMKL